MLLDKGTYLYTAILKKRDLLRSVKSHFVPYYGYEPQSAKGVFGYLGNEKVIIQDLNTNKVKLRYVTDTIEHHRDIKIEKGKFIIIDEGNSEFELL